MFKEKIDKIYISLIVLISALLVFDLFFNNGHSAHMDGRVHITTITQFYRAMLSGDLKPTWSNWFANYGMPVPMVAHQLISYLGAWITLITNNTITSWKIVALIATVLSNVIFYRFLRIYFVPLASFVAVFLYNVAPYRILNLYIREALPEFFASVFFPLVLMALYYLIKERKLWAIPFLTIAMAGLALSHPMMLVVSMFIVVPYFFFLLKDEKDKIRPFLLSGFLMVWGLLMAAYYLLPLQIEIKYFYYGRGNHLTPGQTLHLQNFIDPNWYYFLERDILNRGHFVTPGLFEVIIVAMGVLFVLGRVFRNRKWKPDLLDLTVLVSIVTLLFTTDYALIFYQKINLLSNIQFPWRMLSLFIFLPPIIVAYLLNKTNVKVMHIAAFCLIAFFAITRFPQLYSKNNTNHPMSRYLFTVINLHSTNMNTVWTGETVDYPVHPEKVGIIGGTGKVVKSELSNSWRKYSVDNETETRMVDYTFYFPGWKVWVDGQPVEIQFQDPDYRGVITYNVPAGKHDIYLKFTNTKVRLLGNAISVAAVLGFIIAYQLQRRYHILEKFTKYPPLS